MWASGSTAQVLSMTDDTWQPGSEPTGNFPGDARVVNNWGGSFTDGDIKVWDGAAWGKGGKVVDGTRVVVAGLEGSGSGSFSGLEGKILRFSGTFPSGSWVQMESNAAMRYVLLTNDPIYGPTGTEVWLWTRTSGMWTRASTLNAPLAVFEQDDVPDKYLLKGMTAIWIDTDDGNRVWLIFKDTVSTVYGVEMTQLSAPA